MNTKAQGFIMHGIFYLEVCLRTSEQKHKTGIKDLNELRKMLHLYFRSAVQAI